MSNTALPHPGAPMGRDMTEPASPRQAVVWRTSLALATGSFVLHFVYHYFDDVARNAPGTLAHRLIEEATGSFTLVPLFVLLVAFTWRWPLDRDDWARSIPAQILG